MLQVERQNQLRVSLYLFALSVFKYRVRTVQCIYQKKCLFLLDTEFCVLLSRVERPVLVVYFSSL